MSAEPNLQDLVEKARSGDFEPFQDLLDFLKKQGPPDAARLLELVRSEEAVLRRAALGLAGDDVSDELLAAFAALADDPATAVRQALAQAAERAAWWPLDSVVGKLLEDADSDVRLEAVRAARHRPA